MTDPHDELELKLAELARRSQAVRPRPGFDARVMQRLRADGALEFRGGLIRAGRRSLAAAALLAVLALVWAVQSESSSNAALAVAADPVGLTW